MSADTAGMKRIFPAMREVVCYRSISGETYDALLGLEREDGRADLEVLIRGRPALDLTRVPRDDARAQKGTWSRFGNGEKPHGEEA